MWTAPPTMVAGQLITAIFWNLMVRDNSVALRAGGIAIASQTAGDFIYAGSSTQWARLAGVANKAAYRASGAWTAQSIIDIVYPIGAIFKTTSSANVNTVFGVGSWTPHGIGRVLVGLDGTQTEFDTVNETGGERTHVLTTGAMPSHTHAPSDPGHNHLAASTDDPSTGGAGVDYIMSYPGTDGNVLTSSSATGVTLANTGSGVAHENMSPYITVHIWKRVG